MAVRQFKRKRNGQFAKTAGSAARAVKSATKASGRKATKKVRRSYVKGSFEKNLEVGQGGAYKGVKVGAEFRSPAGRGAVVKGIVGYHGKPDRLLDVKPKLNKPAKTLTVTVKPNSAPSSSSASAKRATAGSKTMRTPTSATAAGKRVRR
ncbi:hypothetical protein [Rhodococcus sp. UNC23MFCrub1.1]|uniref:hypothetical protein n=1 Tax=Rhodococcus sp. UNC23MFCrub1.1 TaxID=1449068 RepID=UPI000691502F|nr:hypothetical protein [Rhodococcus sp. UNC23MFCrub1.1]